MRNKPATKFKWNPSRRRPNRSPAGSQLLHRAIVAIFVGNLTSPNSIITSLGERAALILRSRWNGGGSIFEQTVPKREASDAR